MPRSMLVERSALAICVAVVLFGARVSADPQLGALLQPAPSTRDPRARAEDELAAQLQALERRAYAADPEVQRALTRVRLELVQLRAARDQAAWSRRNARVWAALSWADRLEARVRSAAAIAGLAARADEAEAALLRQQKALARARAEESP